MAAHRSGRSSTRASVLVVQPAKLRDRVDTAVAVLDGARLGRVAVQPQVAARGVAVPPAWTGSGPSRLDPAGAPLSGDHGTAAGRARGPSPGTGGCLGGTPARNTCWNDQLANAVQVPALGGRHGLYGQLGSGNP